MRITRNILRFILFASIFGWIALSFTSLPVLKEDEVKIWCSDCQDPLWKIVIQAIDNAQKEIYLDIYSLTDPQILKALNKAAKRGVTIEILYDKKRHPKPINLDPNIIQSSYQISGLAHRKVLVIDRSQTYIGSANFTPSSLRIDSNHIIAISHPEIANFFSRKTATNNSFFFNDQTISCFSFPEDRKKTLELILQMMQTAENKIEVALYTLSHALLIESLVSAHRRGISVTVYLDARSARGICKEVVETLKKEKIPTYLGSTAKTLHHKWMVVDQKKMICGSCNWTKAAFNKNQESLLFLEPLKPNQKNKIENAFKALRATGKKIACLLLKQPIYLRTMEICLFHRSYSLFE